MANQGFERPLRVVQTNLQIKDTTKINPVELARQIDELGGNALVFNVGGIYAWYDTDVDHHTKNPYLPEDTNLLEEVIEECHDRDIEFIGRVDFSKANDDVYAHKPEWFARTPDGDAKTIGAERPGDWPILRFTCLNSAYRKDGVALPVIEEIISSFDVDGIFYNAPHYITCHCDTCKRKYEDHYGEPLPDETVKFHEDWAEQCVRDNMEPRYRFIKDLDPDVEMVLYYDHNGDDLPEHAAMSDLVCTESQNILSLGHSDLPERWKPAQTMKIGNTVEDGPDPIGIIHSSPGMDWRHTGLPPAEYEYWLSQIPANKGTIWHSLTGIPDTIVDDRLLEVVRDVNHKTEQIDPLMEDATSVAETVLLWDDSEEAHALFNGLIQQQFPFDLLLREQAELDRFREYDLVVVPADWEFDPQFVDDLCRFVDSGGRLLVEGGLPDDADRLFELLGVADNPDLGEDLVASYSRLEGTENPLQRGMEDTDLLPHRGPVAYCDPADGAETLLTLVPQWSPLEAVGKPPERASLHVSHTDIPMAIAGSTGRTLYLPFRLSSLISEYQIDDHYRLLENAIDHLLGDRRTVQATSKQGLQLTPFETENGYLLHLVNGTGDRPLKTTTPVSDIDVELSLEEGLDVTGVRSAFSGERLDFLQDDSQVSFTVPSVAVWEAIHVHCESRS